MAVDAATSMSEAEANRQMILRHRQGGGTPNKVNIAGWDTDAYTPDEVQEAWSNALEETDVSPDLLVDLAEDRADAIREALVKSFGLEDDWIYLKPTELDAADDPITIHIDYIND